MNDESTIPNSGCDPPAGSGPGGSNPNKGIPFTPDESAAASTVGAQLDYKLLRLIGRGAYGEVWLARDKLRAYRAIKVVFRASFDHDRPYEREYDGIRKFEPISRSYDHQVQILHVGRQDEQGRFYYIMELADDQYTGQQIEPQTYVPKTLKSELQRRGRYPVADCLRIAAALAAALENLHQHGLIHRDIKPGNIIFVNGVPKLADIGLVTDRDVSVSYVGTEGYIPPEGPSSAQGDIYSLGKVLYEMATGGDRMDFPELPTSLQELPDRDALLELNAVLAKACARNPRERYRTAREMFADLARLQQGKSVRGGKLWRAGLALVAKAGVAAVLFGLVALGVHYFWKAKPPPSVALTPHSISPPSFPAGVSPISNMVWIQPGTFTMGSPVYERGRWSDEGPQTPVRISRGFWMGIYEVTQREYLSLINTNPSRFTGDLNRPVERVSWYDAANYCAALTARERSAGRLPTKYLYRLPTEAEWEYACRAGTRTRFTYGDAPTYSSLSNYCWYACNGTYPVGQKLPNPWCLYDMIGNVAEWCLDWRSTYPGVEVTDPQGPAIGKDKARRGGSWPGSDWTFRSSWRFFAVPETKVNDIGFRVVLAPTQP